MFSAHNHYRIIVPGVSCILRQKQIHPLLPFFFDELRMMFIKNRIMIGLC